MKKLLTLLVSFLLAFTCFSVNYVEEVEAATSGTYFVPYDINIGSSTATFKFKYNTADSIDKQLGMVGIIFDVGSSSTDYSNINFYPMDTSGGSSVGDNIIYAYTTSNGTKLSLNNGVATVTIAKSDLSKITYTGFTPNSSNYVWIQVKAYRDTGLSLASGQNGKNAYYLMYVCLGCYDSLSDFRNLKQHGSTTPTTSTISSLSFSDPSVVSGGTPQTTISGSGFSGTISWSPSVSKFTAGSAYTATAILYPNTGYSFSTSATLPYGWTKSYNTSGGIIATKTFIAASASSLVPTGSVLATCDPPSGYTLTNFKTNDAIIQELSTKYPTINTLVIDNGNYSYVDLPIEWTLDGDFNKGSSASNTYRWTLIPEYYSGARAVAGCGTTDTISIVNPSHAHTWEYSVEGNILTAKCTCANDSSCTYNGKTEDERIFTLTLDAKDAIKGDFDTYAATLDTSSWNTTDLTTPTIEYYKVDTKGATTGGTKLEDLSNLEIGHYYASITINDVTAVKSFEVTTVEDKIKSVDTLYDKGEKNLDEDDVVTIKGVDYYVLQVTDDKAELITKDIYDVRFDDGGHTSGDVMNYVGTGDYAGYTYNYAYSTLQSWMNDTFYNSKLKNSVISNNIISRTVISYTNSTRSEDLDEYSEKALTNQYVYALDAKEAQKYASQFSWSNSIKQINATDYSSATSNNSNGFWTTAGYYFNNNASAAFDVYYEGGEYAFEGRNVDTVTIGARPTFWASLHDHDDVTFNKEISTYDELVDLFINGGNGYLANNITVEHNSENAALSIAEGKSVNLCLNGYSINGERTSSGSSTFIELNKNATLNIYDCKGTGLVTYKSNNTYNPGTLFNLYGENSSLTIYGGTYKNIADKIQGTGVNVYGNNSKFYMYDGTITNCATAITTNITGKKNINIYLYGGTITGNDKGVNLRSGYGVKCTLGGNINVVNNYTEDNGYRNIYIDYSYNKNYDDILSFETSDDLKPTSGMKVGINTNYAISIPCDVDYVSGDQVALDNYGKAIDEKGASAKLLINYDSTNKKLNIYNLTITTQPTKDSEYTVEVNDDNNVEYIWAKYSVNSRNAVITTLDGQDNPLNTSADYAAYYYDSSSIYTSTLFDNVNVLYYSRLNNAIGEGTIIEFESSNANLSIASDLIGCLSLTKVDGTEGNYVYSYEILTDDFKDFYVTSNEQFTISNVKIVNKEVDWTDPVQTDNKLDTTNLTSGEYACKAYNTTNEKAFAISNSVNVYDVSFELNGGSLNEGVTLPTNYLGGNGLTLTTGITKTGYKFAGWYETSDFTGDPVTAISATDKGNKTYYARWYINEIDFTSISKYAQKNSDDSYSLVGNITVANTNIAVANSKYFNGLALVLLRSNDEFITNTSEVAIKLNNETLDYISVFGLVSENNLDTYKNYFSDVKVGDYVLGWTLYTLTYDVNTTDATTGTLPVDTNKYSKTAKITLSNNPYSLSKPGYKLIGWNDGKDTYDLGATYEMGSKNVVLKAVWSEYHEHDDGVQYDVKITTADEFKSFIQSSTSKTGYLGSDIELNSAGLIINEDIKLDLCLNGHTLTINNNDANKTFITLSKNSTLNIYDCTDRGTVKQIGTNDVDFINFNDEDAKLNIYGGSYDSATSMYFVTTSKDNSLINIENAKFTGNWSFVVAIQNTADQTVNLYNVSVEDSNIQGAVNLLNDNNKGASINIGGSTRILNTKYGISVRTLTDYDLSNIIHFMTGDKAPTDDMKVEIYAVGPGSIIKNCTKDYSKQVISKNEYLVKYENNTIVFYKYEITQQPTIDNNYEVSTNAESTYNWATYESNKVELTSGNFNAYVNNSTSTYDSDNLFGSASKILKYVFVKNVSFDSNTIIKFKSDADLDTPVLSGMNEYGTLSGNKEDGYTYNFNSYYTKYVGGYMFYLTSDSEFTISDVEIINQKYTLINEDWAKVDTLDTSKIDSTKKYACLATSSADTRLSVYSDMVSFNINDENITIGTIDNQTYTGGQIKPSVVVKDGNTTLTQDEDYTLSYSNNTNPGTATVTVTGTGKYSGSKNVSFTIVNADLVVTANDQTFTYNGNKQGNSISAQTVDNSTPTIKYRISDSGDYTLTTVPTFDTAGTYTVYYQVSATSHNEVTGSYKVTINSKNASTLTIEDINNLTYTGSALTPSVVVKDGTKTLTENTDYTVSYSNNTNAGTATVTITGKGNYTGTTTKNFTIDNASITVSAPNQTYTYNGLSQGVGISATTVNSQQYTIYYGTSATTCSSTTVPTYKDAGTYTVYYKVTAANHSDKTGSYTITINKAQLSINEVTINDKIYDGTNNASVNTISFNGLVNNETLTKDTDYSLTANFNSKDVASANKVTVTVTLKDTTKANNYNLAINTKDVTKNIGEKAITIADATIADKTYDGTTAATVTGVTFNGLVSGETLSINNDYTIDSATFNSKDAGNRTVTFKVKLADNSNYYFETGKDTSTKAKDITKKEISIKSVDIASKTYDGTTTATINSVTFDGLVTGESFTKGTDYTVTGVFDSKDVNTATKVTSTVTLINNNYNLKVNTNETSKTITAKQVNTLVVSNISPLTYTGSKLEPTVTITDGTVTLVKDSDYVVTYANNTNAGTATVTVVGKGNYAGTTTKNFTINKASITVNNNDQTYTYDGLSKGNPITVTTVNSQQATIKYGEVNGTYNLTTAPKYSGVKLDSNGNVVPYTVYYQVSAPNHETKTGSYTVTINQKDVSSLVINSIADKTYTGNEFKPDIEVYDGSYKLVKDSDYTLEYTDNTNAGKANITVTYKGNYTGTSSTYFNINKVPSGDAPTGITYDENNKLITGLDKDVVYEIKLPDQSIVTVDNADTYDPSVNDKLVPGTYSIRIKGDNNHEASGWANVTVEKESVKINSTYASDITDKQVTLNAELSSSDDVTKVEVQYREKGSDEWTTLACDIDNNISKTISDLKVNTEYEYQYVVTSDNATITSDTLSFKTTKSNAAVGKIKVEVTNKSNETKDVVVSIKQGNTVLATRTIEDLAVDETSYTTEFNKLPDGVYGLVVMSEDGKHLETKTITITDGSSENVSSTITTGISSTNVEIKGDDTPSVAVEGLNEIISDTEKNAIKDGSLSVDVTLDVEKVEISEEVEDKVNNIINDDEQIDSVIDMSLFKTTKELDSDGNITSEKTNNIGSNNGQVLEVVIPNSYNAISSLKIIRVHNGIAQELGKISARALSNYVNGTYYVDAKYIYIYSSDFSDYALITPLTTSDKDIFESYKETKKDEVDDLELGDDSDDSIKLIEDAKKAINDVNYDDSKSLDDNKAIVDSIIDELNKDLAKQRFDDYQTAKLEEVENLVKDDDSITSKNLISKALADIIDVTYDETLTLDENKANIDDIVDKLIEDLNNQRYDEYKDKAIITVNNLSKDDDSDASKELINKAIKAINELTYDNTKSYEYNINLIDTIIEVLNNELAIQRDKDAYICPDTSVKEASNNNYLFSSSLFTLGLYGVYKLVRRNKEDY